MRRVTTHQARSIDNEELVVLTVFEEGVNKEKVKKLNRFTKRHGVLIKQNHFYDWKKKA